MNYFHHLHQLLSLLKNLTEIPTILEEASLKLSAKLFKHDAENGQMENGQRTFLI